MIIGVGWWNHNSSLFLIQACFSHHQIVIWICFWFSICQNQQKISTNSLSLSFIFFNHFSMGGTCWNIFGWFPLQQRHFLLVAFDTHLPLRGFHLHWLQTKPQLKLDQALVAKKLSPNRIRPFLNWLPKRLIKMQSKQQQKKLKFDQN